MGKRGHGSAKPSRKISASKTVKQRLRSGSSNNKYSKSGILPQLCCSRAFAALSSADKEKNRLNDENLKSRCQNCSKGNSKTMLSNNLLTPVTPRKEEQDFDSCSRIEALPMDLLVKILCHLHHDQLKAVFHVSTKIRMAVSLARQIHFNYNTPDRSRQEKLLTTTPLLTEHWLFLRGKGEHYRSPCTPKAPRLGPRPSRVTITEMKQVAAVLFKEPPFCHTRCGTAVPSILAKQQPLCKNLASNRVLVYEDELCHAVAQNNLR